MIRITARKSSEIVSLLLEQGFSRTKAKQLLKHGAVSVNGKPAILASFIKAGDLIEINKDKREKITAPEFDISIVYEDEELIIVNKPSGLLSIATEKEKTRTVYYQLNRFLRERNPAAHERVFIVHRLDMDTSGLLVLAKNENTKRKLQGGWKEVEKRYFAVVEGVPQKKDDEIRTRLTETRTLKVFSDRSPGESGLSITKYSVLKSGTDYALLDVVLRTGRKNQIRVHLSELGHPIAGDKKYGAATNPFGRLGLHARLLSFKHPVTGKPLRFESKMPQTFGKIVNRMKTTGRGNSVKEEKEHRTPEIRR